MNQNELILYHHNSSVCAAKVRVALAEKSLPFESRLLRLNGDQFDPSYKKLNPHSVVPTLVHRGRTIIESNVILEYLEDAFPQHGLRPADPFSRAMSRLLLQRLEGGGSGIHHAASVVTYAIAYRHSLIEEAGGTDRPRLSEVIAKNMNPKSRYWLEDVVYQGTDAPVVRKTVERFDRLFADFETRLGQTAWLACDQYSIADVAFTPYLVRLDLLGMNCLWQNRPAVSKWHSRLMARKSINAVYDWYDPKIISALTDYGREARPRVEELLARGSADGWVT